MKGLDNELCLRFAFFALPLRLLSLFRLVRREPARVQAAACVPVQVVLAPERFPTRDTLPELVRLSFAHFDDVRAPRVQVLVQVVQCDAVTEVQLLEDLGLVLEESAEYLPVHPVPVEVHFQQRVGQVFPKYLSHVYLRFDFLFEFMERRPWISWCPRQSRLPPGPTCPPRAP